MSLSNEQYNQIMLEYSQTRDRHLHELQRRRSEVYTKIPAYRDLENAIPDLLSQNLRMVLGRGEQSRTLPEDDRISAIRDSDPQNHPVRQTSGNQISGVLYPDSDRKTSGNSISDSQAFAASGNASRLPEGLQEQVRSIVAQKKALLEQAGFPPDYLEMTYTCPDCKDTGYIGTKKCHCLRAKEIAVLYDQSHLRELTKRDNFKNLSDSWYQGEDLARFHVALNAASHFINNFRKDYENLYFYGTVGTGKSFLSICIADQLLHQGQAVLYFSASAMFERISSYIFGSRSRDEYRAFCDDLYGCDLLIIDDLGTELTNSFVSSQLFACLNERHLNHKSTIISSNLSLEELRDRYSDRIFSRITSNYTVCKLTGPDIRIMKKVRERNGSYGTNKNA